MKLGAAIDSIDSIRRETSGRSKGNSGRISLGAGLNLLMSLPTSDHTPSSADQGNGESKLCTEILGLVRPEIGWDHAKSRNVKKKNISYDAKTLSI